MKNTDHNIIIYQNSEGNVKLDVHLENETVWINRQQMAELFDRDVKTIGKHINNVFNEGELDKKSTVANFATVQNKDELDKDSVVAKFETTATDGKSYQIEYYNLDVIISLGYRVKSAYFS